MLAPQFRKFGSSAKSVILLVLSIFISFNSSFSQCMSYPVSLQERVDNSQMIVQGKLASQHSYWDTEMKNIYTLNVIDITAFLKGNNGAAQIAIITEGGVVGMRAQVTHPSLEIRDYNEYIFFLQGNNLEKCDVTFKTQFPGMMQVLTYASSQGALTKQFGKYVDTYSEKPQDEISIFNKIAELTGEKATEPGGKKFLPRVEQENTAAKVQMPITTIAPNPSRAGTIVPADWVTITGSGFGAAPGNVFWSNADDGGATFVGTGVASDYISWTASSINVKPLRNAGTGPYFVNGLASPANANFQYAHIDISSNFNGFGGITTKQKYFLVDKNGLGGYTFTYNTAFSGNAAAVAAFGRALDTWRCQTFVNFRMSGATSAIVTAALDGVNIIYFEPTLPAGVLGVTTTYYSGSSLGACTGVNTVWWLQEADIQFRTIPLGGFTWNFGPAASIGTNYDFESVALHELGHAHGLTHIINFGQAMHYAIANGADLRVISAADVAGGNAKMAYSILPLCFIPAGVLGPMTNYVCNLPIHLVRLNAECIDGKAKIDWSTSPGIKNDTYVIEKSVDGMNYEYIGKIEGATNSDQIQNYTFADPESLEQNTYYRLKVIDQEGGVDRSEPIEVSCKKEDPPVTIYPNPAEKKFTLSGVTENSEVKITDMYGRVIKNEKTNSTQQEFDCTDLPKGIYFVSIVDQKNSKVAHRTVTKLIVN
jgi:hypothetical protein